MHLLIRKKIRHLLHLFHPDYVRIRQRDYAELLAPKVEIPRIQNSETLPGFPEVCIAKMPGTLPARALAIEPEGFAF